MAATVELLKRLDSDGEPIAKRLCLAQNVFQSVQLPLPRKEESITNWLCQVAGKFKEKGKRKSLPNSSEDFVKLWSTLHACVTNPIFNTADIRPSIKTYLIEVLCKQLKRKDLSHSDALLVTECAITVLRAKSFLSYYGTNPSLFVNFANNLLKALSIDRVEHAQLIQNILNSFEYIVKNIKPTDELRLIFLDEMLFTLAELFKFDKSQSTPLSKTISRCLKQVLFPATSSDFFEFLGANISDSASDKQYPVPSKLLTILEETRSTMEEDSYITLINMIFISFATGHVKAAKDPNACIFPMCVLLSYLVGFEVTSEKSLVSYKRLKKICQKGELKSMSLSILSNMITVLAQWGISLTTNINSTSFSDWIKVLVESLFSTPASLDLIPFLKLMSSLLKLDPYLVESYLKKIFDVVMASPLSEEVKPTYTAFMSEVLAFYHKLSRSPHFIKTFVESLQEGFKKQQESGILPPSQNMWLSPTLIQQLLDDATVMPSASLIRVLNFLIIQCETHVELDEAAPLNNGYRNLLIHTVCELLSATLRGVRMLELSATDTARDQFCSVMTRIKLQLSSFGKFVLGAQGNNGPAISSFLTVSYHWAAGAILIEQYADAGREELLLSVGTDLKTECRNLQGGGILSYLHPYLSSKEWESIYDKIINLEDEECKKLLLKLDIQLLSALLMFNSSQSTVPKVVAKRACALMVRWPTDVCDRDTISNVILMAPVLDAAELSTLGEWLTPSLLAGNNDKSLHDVMTLLTEERLVSCSLVCSVLNSLSRKLKVSKRKKDESGVKAWRVSKAVLGKLDGQVVVQQELEGLTMSEAMSSVLLSMASPLSDALSSLNGCQGQSPGEETDLDNLLQHLRMLQSFPLRYFTTGCKGVVFLSLLSVAVDCSPLAPSETKDSILQEIFDHLLLGLYEKGQHLCPKLEGYLDRGALIGALAYFVVHHNAGRRLLELLLDQALHQEPLQEPILERIMVMKSEGKKQTPSKENLLLGTVFLKVTSELNLKPESPMDTSVSLDQSTSNPKDLKKARKKLVKSFENLIQQTLLNTEDELLAYALVLEYYLSLEKDIENLLPKFERFCHSAVDFLNSSQRAQIEASESFILTVCRHRQKVTVFPEFFVKDVWSHLTQSKQPNKSVLKAIIQAATDDETSFIMSDLLSKTQHLNYDQKLEDDKCSSNIVQIWSMLLRFNTLTTVHKKSPMALREMFRLYQLGKVPLQQLLGFLNDFLLSQKVKLHMQTVDLCFLILHDVQLPKTPKEFIPAAKQFLSVLSAVFLHHLHLALDCVPSFLQMLQRLVNELAKVSAQRPELSRAESADLAGVAFEAEKLVTAFTKPDLKKSLARVSAYFLADLLAIFETTILCPPVKKHFENMVYVLMSILDKYSSKFLLRVMSTSSTAIFNNFEKSYKKFHLFKGKV